MVKLIESGAYLINGSEIVTEGSEKASLYNKADAKKATMAYRILESHNTSGNMEKLKIKFDKLTSHDITFV